MKIVEAQKQDLALFFEYLARQLVENANDDSPLFQPIAKQHSYVSEPLRVKFQKGFDSSIGASGWRKLWLVKDSTNNICGHIDLRHYNSDYSYHRVLLGMGVDLKARKQGLGIELIKTVVKFCNENSHIDWLDLNVLSNNIPAKNLYLKSGFLIIGEMADCYRIDQKPIAEITMSLCTKTPVCDTSQA